MIDLFGGEPQFVDHLAAVWHALPEQERGQFLVVRGLEERAARRGIAADLDAVDSRRPVLVASYGDIKKVRRLGRTRIAFIEHGIGQSYAGDKRSATHPSYPGGQDRNDLSLILVPNEHAANRWRDAYPSMNVRVVGCPRLDSLPRREPGPGPVIAVSFHVSFSIAPETRSAWSLYRDVLPDLMQQYQVIGHGHPRWMGQLAKYYRRLGIEVVPDFDDVCRRADLYVCDNSSTLYEFASTGRPVVVLNAPWFRRTVEHGLRFWSAADVGVQVDRPAELLPAVQRALLDREEQQERRAAALGIVYGQQTHSPEATTSALMGWALTLEAVAA